MNSFWKIFYNLIVVPLLWILIQIVGFFNEKFRIGIDGRKNLFEELKLKTLHLEDNAKRVWFHVSSLGEFEQAKPLIVELKKMSPSVKIIVSFFSPSGYEPSRKYKFADVITYIPFDSYFGAKKFISIIKPSVAIFIRYDLWPNHIWALKRQKIPIIIANATMRKNTVRRFPVIKSFHRNLYNQVDFISVVSENDLKGFGIFKLTRPSLMIIGDTRYDQVWQRCQESIKKHTIAEKIIKNKRILVAGSTWEADEKILFPIFKDLQNQIDNLLIILVPHEPDRRNLERIENELNGEISFIKYSELNDYAGEKIIVIDSIGILMSIYQYAQVAFVGGSFRGSIHNILEPAVYSIPVVFGPYFKNSQEAINLLNCNGAFSCENSEELLNILIRLFTDENFRLKAGSIAGNFVKQSIGATQRFFSYVQKVL